MKFKKEKIEVNEIHLDIDKKDIVHFRFPDIYFTLTGQQILDHLMSNHWEIQDNAPSILDEAILKKEYKTKKTKSK